MIITIPIGCKGLLKKNNIVFFEKSFRAGYKIRWPLSCDYLIFNCKWDYHENWFFIKNKVFISYGFSYAIEDPVSFYKNYKTNIYDSRVMNDVAEYIQKIIIESYMPPQNELVNLLNYSEISTENFNVTNSTFLIQDSDERIDIVYNGIHISNVNITDTRIFKS